MMPTNPVELINNDAKARGYEAIDFESFAAKYPSETFKKEGVDKVTISSPCEATLAIHLCQNKHRPRHVAIGVSKGLCWLCQQFVESLSRLENLWVLVSANQGKIHPGWAMPPGTPGTVEAWMRGLVKLEVREIREGMIARRRSDPFPTEDRELFAEGVPFDNSVDNPPNPFW